MVRVDEEAALIDSPKEPWWKANKFYSQFVFPFTIVAVTIIFVVIFVPDSGSDSGSDQPATGPKNFILMIPDGFGSSAYSFGAYRYREKGLNYTLDDYVVGKCRTFSADNLITDSAAAATALACGVKTNNDVVGKNERLENCTTVLESAKAKGLRTGLVASSRITHATPAGFSAHVEDRDLEQEIARQQVDLRVDVLFGGGLREFDVIYKGENTLDVAERNGYTTALNLEQLTALNNLPAIGLFSSSHIPFKIDRTAGSVSLVDMTSKALELLNKGNENGFFLMVEGSRIDQAGHDNDAAAMSGEIFEFEETVRLVMKFAKDNPATQVVIVADHETGGFSLGSGYLDVKFWNPNFVDQVSNSAQFMYDTLIDDVALNPATYFLDVTGITLSAEEATEFETLVTTARNTDGSNEDEVVFWIGIRVSKEANLGWTSDEHTSTDVEIFAYGPQTDVYRGFHDNTNIPKAISAYLELGLFDGN